MNEVVKAIFEEEFMENLSAASAALYASCYTKKGINCVLDYLAEDIVGDDYVNLTPKYKKAVKKTMSIAAFVLARKLNEAYGDAIKDIVKGAYDGYKAGRKMAEGQNLS